MVSKKKRKPPDDAVDEIIGIWEDPDVSLDDFGEDKGQLTYHIQQSLILAFLHGGGFTRQALQTGWQKIREASEKGGCNAE